MENKENKNIEVIERKESKIKKEIKVKKDVEQNKENIKNRPINNKTNLDNKENKENKEILKVKENKKDNKSEDDDNDEVKVKYFDISKINNIQIPKEYINIIYYNLLKEEEEGINQPLITPICQDKKK